MRLYINVLLFFIALIALTADFSAVKKLESKMASRGCLEISYDRYGEPICVERIEIFAKK